MSLIFDNKIVDDVYKICSERFYPRRLTLEPTAYCEVGCGHCKYSSRKFSRTSEIDYRFGRQVVNRIIGYLYESKVDEIIISGGGEPTYEMGILKRFLKVGGLKKVSIYTAAQWAQSYEKALAFYHEIAEAWSNNLKSELIFRISVDRFHLKCISRDMISNAISSFFSYFASDINVKLHIRSVDGDQSLIEGLLGLSGFEVSWDDEGHFRGRAVRGENTIFMTFMSLVPTGRMSAGSMPAKSDRRVSEYDKVYAQMYGVGWPVLIRGGLNVGVRPTGHLYLYGGPPHDYGSINNQSVEMCLKNMYRDPITLCLLFYGFGWIYEVLDFVGIDRREFRNKAYNPSVFVSYLLSDHRLSVYAYLYSLLRLAEDPKQDHSLRSLVIKFANKKFGSFPKHDNIDDLVCRYRQSSEQSVADLGVSLGGRLRI